MHILTTDLLTCPRCGPAFGLIVLADALDDRRIREGRLGCANCRQSYPIQRGVADLRHPSAVPMERAGDGGTEAERAFRLAALMGVQAANRAVLVIEPTGLLAAEVADTLPEVHVLGAVADDEPAELPSAREGRGTLSRLQSGARIPLRTGSVHGVGVVDLQPAPLLAEISRVMVEGARLVVDPAAPEQAEALSGAGFTVLLEQDGIVVAAISGRG